MLKNQNQQQPSPQLDKEAIEASKKAHIKAKNCQETVKK